MPNNTQTKGTSVQLKSKTKSRINKRQRNRRRNKQKLQNHNQNKDQTSFGFSDIAHTKGAQVWGQAYVNAVRWHGEHQNNFWRHAAEQLQMENEMLRQQLHSVANIKPETILDYETSDEDDEKNTVAVKIEEDEVDSKYLEFLQVTIKHREELRLKREAADLLEEEGEGSITGANE